MNQEWLAYCHMQRTFLWAVLFPISLIVPLVSQAEEGKEQQSKDKLDEAVALAPKMSLVDYLKKFLATDPTWRVVVLEKDIAAIAVSKSQDRLGLDIQAGPGARYDALGYDGSYTHLGTFYETDFISKMEDNQGGTLSIVASGRAVTHPSKWPTGHQVGFSAQYAIPLWRNLLGRLYELETTYLQHEESARQKEAEAMILERCSSGIELYLTAYLLQEQWTVWQDLLAHRERMFKRTKIDYGRRMITKLDYLAARSDWIAAQQQNTQLDGKRRLALVSLFSYLPGQQANELILASPRDPLEVIRGRNDLKSRIEKHPMVMGYELTAKALEDQSVYLERYYEPEIFLTPQAGVDFQSHLPLPTGGSTGLTDLYAGLGVGITLPVIQPEKDYELATLQKRAQQFRTHKTGAVRSLSERADRAKETITELDARLKLTDEKMEIIQGQIKEAAAYFYRGKLEFQDYLQHRAIYENARFEKIDLLYRRWLAQVELLRAVGPVPEMCQVVK